jgi:pilus assembly protein CpaE
MRTIQTHLHHRIQPVSPKILVVDDEPITRKMISTMLERNQFSVAVAENGKDCLRMLPVFTPDMVLLDVMMPEMDGYETCRLIRSNLATSRLPVIMLTALDSIEQKVKGFEAGADDYLPKPFNSAELLAHIHALLRFTGVALPQKVDKIPSTTLAVFSLRGGSGVTSIAVNLAAGLAQLWEQDVALVDMVPVAGQSALFLNQTLKTTWTDLVQRRYEEIDDLIVKSVLLQHPSRVFTLASPLKPEDSALITPQKAGIVIDILRKLFSYVVLDLPHDLSETSLASLDRADTILLVLQPEIASIRAGRMAVDIFKALKYEENKFFVLLNWTFPRMGLGLEDIERFIKRKVDLQIPYSVDDFISGLNHGKPPVLTAPDKIPGAIFEDLAMAVSHESQLRSNPQKPSQAWKRVRDRKNVKRCSLY